MYAVFTKASGPYPKLNMITLMAIKSYPKSTRVLKRLFRVLCGRDEGTNEQKLIAARLNYDGVFTHDWRDN
jgi:hypothetical protein